MESSHNHLAENNAQKSSGREKAKLTRERNRASRSIYREKHDPQKQPRAEQPLLHHHPPTPTTGPESRWDSGPAPPSP